MDTHTTIDQARFRLEAAQRELDKATERQAKLDSFPTEGTVFLLMASKVTFDQFVSYSEDGIPVGVFATREEAKRYMQTFEHPVGLDYQIKELPLHR